jgi:hypothetical protein
LSSSSVLPAAASTAAAALQSAEFDEAVDEVMQICLLLQFLPLSLLFLGLDACCS